MVIEKDFVGPRIRTSWGFEWNSVFVMTGWAKTGAGNPSQLTRGAGIWNAGTGAPDIAGQAVIVLNGTSAGLRLHVIEATTDATPDDFIEFEDLPCRRPIFNENWFLTTWTKI